MVLNPRGCLIVPPPLGLERVIAMKAKMITRRLIHLTLIACAVASLFLAGCVSVRSDSKPVDHKPGCCKFEGCRTEIMELGNGIPVQNITSNIRNAFAEIDAKQGRIVSVSVVSEQGAGAGYRIFVTYQVPESD